MKKDVITSTFLHVALFIFFAVSSLFFYKKIELQQINVSLVSSNSLDSPSYKPLELSKEDLQKSKEVENSNKIDTSPKSTSGTGEDLSNRESLLTKDNSKDIPEIPKESEAAKSTTKDNIVSKNNSKQSYKEVVQKADNSLKEKQEKNLFANSILSGLDKGDLSKEELQALNNQIKGCWYGQGGYNAAEDLKVELILTMNADATIRNIEVLNKDSYNTPVRKTLLEQVIRALKDPKCKQLRLPLGAYNNWRIIQITFNPKG